jgi:hypothetical protein
MLQELALDPTYNRLGLLIVAPFLACVSIVSALPRTFNTLLSFQLVLLLANCSQHIVLVNWVRILLTEPCLSSLNSIGPVAQFHENSIYYSAVKPAPNKEVDANLPHVTIQMPIYRESLRETMCARQRTIHSLRVSLTVNAAPNQFTPSKRPCRPTLVKVVHPQFSFTTTVCS